MNYTKFCLIIYRDRQSTCHRFTAEKPIPWKEAKERLLAAGKMDPDLAGMTFKDNGWVLSVAPEDNMGEGDPLP